MLSVFLLDCPMLQSVFLVKNYLLVYLPDNPVMFEHSLHLKNKCGYVILCVVVVLVLSMLWDVWNSITMIQDKHKDYIKAISEYNSIKDRLLDCGSLLVYNLGLREASFTEDVNVTYERKEGDSHIQSKNLYSFEGHEHKVSKHLNDDLLAPLTRWTQSYIYNHQFVSDCSKVKIVVSDGFDSGFGAQMHVTGAMLGYAIEKGYIMILSPYSCKYFTDVSRCDKGCSCLFRPISSCDYNSLVNTTSHLNKITSFSEILDGGVIRENFNNDEVVRYTVPTVLKVALRSKLPSMTDDQIRYWWRAQSIAFIMRLNNATLRAVSRMRHQQSLHYVSRKAKLPFPLPSTSISIHIRGGDKYREMSLVSPYRYIQAVLDIFKQMPMSYSSRTLFVSADDENSLQEARQYAEKAMLPFIYSKIDRMSGGFDLSHWKQQEDIETHIHGHLLQLLMSLEAGVWIGTRSSNWNRLIDELRCVWVDKCSNLFIEVGDAFERNNW